MFFRGRVTLSVAGWAVDKPAPCATIEVEMEPGHLRSGPAQAIYRGRYPGRVRA